jgi:hypothetical protein
MYVIRQHVTETAGMPCTAYGTEGLRAKITVAITLVRIDDRA